MFSCFSEHAASTLEAGRVCVSPVNGGASGGACVGVMPEERSQKSKEELRELWRKAILQQILLQRMERENQKLQGEENTRVVKRPVQYFVQSYFIYIECIDIFILYRVPPPIQGSCRVFEVSSYSLQQTLCLSRRKFDCIKIAS